MSTATTTAAEHYAKVLAEARAATAPVIIPLNLSDIDGLEVSNTEVGERYECVELGPFDGNRYLRIRCTDLVVLADVLRKRADDMQDSAFDERERLAASQQVECPGCRTRIAPDDFSCGAPRCHRIAMQEASS